MQFGLDMGKEMENLNEHLHSNQLDSDSDSEIEIKSNKKTKKYQKNETTMLYLLKSHEDLRLECDMVKMKYYRLKSKNDIMEERAHFAKLDMSNLIVERNTLKQGNNGYFFTMVFSMVINVTFLGFNCYTIYKY